MDTQDAFRPLEPGEASRSGSGFNPGADDFEPLVPPEGSEPPVRHYELGAPVCRWSYYGADADLQGYQYRFDTVDGKEFRPLRYGRRRGREGWHWKEEVEFSTLSRS